MKRKKPREIGNWYIVDRIVDQGKEQIKYVSSKKA